MLEARSSHMFTQNYKNAITKCRGIGKVLKSLEEFKKKANFYVLYEILGTSGTCENKTSNWSEVNHSSVLNHLGEHFCNGLHVLLRELLNRHDTLSLKMNQLIINEGQYMRVEQKRLQDKLIKQDDLIEAAKHLNKDGYDHFVKVFNNQVYYEREEFICEDDVKVYYVYLKDSPSQAEFIEFRGPTCPCDCKDYVSNRVLCVHRYTFLQRFNLQDFDIRYHRRKQVTKSSYIGAYSSNNIYDVLISRNLDINVEEDKSLADKYIELSGGMTSYDDNNELICEPDSAMNANVITRKTIESEHLENMYSTNWLEYNDFKDISDKLYSAMQRNRKFGTLMCGQMLKNLDFLNNLDSMDEIGTKFPTVEKQFLQRIQEHKIMFSSKSTKDSLFATPDFLTADGVHNVQYSSKKRFRSRIEKATANVKKVKGKHNTKTPFVPGFTTGKTNTGKKKSCSFCKSIVCANSKTCDKKQLFGRIITNATEYLSYLQDEAPYREIKDDDKKKFVISPDFSNIKHLQIVEVICKIKQTPMLRPNIDHFAVKINGIDENARVIETCENILVNISHISDIVNNIVPKKLRFVFDKVEYSMGDEYECVKRSDNKQYQLSLLSQSTNHESQHSQGPNHASHLSQMTMTPYYNTSQIQYNNTSQINYYNQNANFDADRYNDWSYNY